MQVNESRRSSGRLPGGPKVSVYDGRARTSWDIQSSSTETVARGRFSRPQACSNRWGLAGQTELLHHRHVVSQPPTLDGTPLREPQRAHRHHVDMTTGRWQSHEFICVMTSHTAVGDGDVGLGDNEVDRVTKVREPGAHHRNRRPVTFPPPPFQAHELEVVQRSSRRSTHRSDRRAPHSKSPRSPETSALWTPQCDPTSAPLGSRFWWDARSVVGIRPEPTPHSFPGFSPSCGQS